MRITLETKDLEENLPAQAQASTAAKIKQIKQQKAAEKRSKEQDN